MLLPPTTATRLPALLCAVSLVAGAFAFGSTSASMASARPQQAFSVEDALSYSFPTQLTAAADGSAIAWVLNEQGARNIWVAEAPDFAGRRLTAYEDDDGQAIGNLQFAHSGRQLVYVRGGAPNRAGELPNPVSYATGASREIWAVDVAGGAPLR